MSSFLLFSGHLASQALFTPLSFFPFLSLQILGVMLQIQNVNFKNTPSGEQNPLIRCSPTDT